MPKQEGESQINSGQEELAAFQESIEMFGKDELVKQLATLREELKAVKGDTGVEDFVRQKIAIVEQEIESKE